MLRWARSMLHNSILKTVLEGAPQWHVMTRCDMRVPFEPFGQLPRTKEERKGGKEETRKQKNGTYWHYRSMPAQVDERWWKCPHGTFCSQPFFIVVVVYVRGNKGTVLYNNRNLGTPRVRPELILQSVEKETHGRDSSRLLLNHWRMHRRVRYVCIYIYMEGLLEGFRHAACTGPIPSIIANPTSISLPPQ